MYRRGEVWYCSLSVPGGERKKFSLGTKDATAARRIDHWMQDVQERFDRSGVIRAIYDGQLTTVEAYTLGEQAAAALVARRVVEANNRPIDAAVLSDWVQWIVKRGVRPLTAARYRIQVETLYPQGLRERELTPANIMDKLDALDVAETTKGRYRAAMGSLCAFLTRTRFLDANPMPSVGGYPQSVARCLYYSRADAMRLLSALPAEQRGIEAVMYACGWEMAACQHALVEDFDPDGLTAFARGTKTVTRTRLTVITEPEVLAWIREDMRNKHPKAPMWPRLDRFAILRRHQAVCKALGLPVTTLHDWRHTYAVKELKKGVSPSAVAQMLGHTTSALVIRNYGNHTSTPEEVRERAKALLRVQSGFSGVAETAAMR